MGVWGQKPHLPEARAEIPSALSSPTFGDFYNFLMKLTRFYVYLDLNFCFKIFLYFLQLYKTVDDLGTIAWKNKTKKFRIGCDTSVIFRRKVRLMVETSDVARPLSYKTKTI